MYDLREWHSFFQKPDASATYKAKIDKKEDDIHAFLSLDMDRLKNGNTRQTDPPKTLHNILFAVKDNIAVRDFPLTCGSRMLEHFTSPYHATAIRKLLDEGAVPIGKTNMDEFGMGSTTDNSALTITNNPWDLKRVCGGSSGGSAAAVAAGMVPFALGTDTGGSVRQPAAFCGVFGLKPTYGTVSRYGLVAYASSLEVIGVLSPSVKIAREVYSVIRGRDPLDQSSVEYRPGGSVPKKLRVGVLSGDLGLAKPVDKVYRESVEKLKGLGFEIDYFDLPILEYAIPAYYTIATAEASANLARYVGVRYGHRTTGAGDFRETIRMTREEGFGEEVKLRILLGSYVLRSGFQDQYYIRA